MKYRKWILLVVVPVAIWILAEIGVRIFAPPGEFPVMEARFTNEIPGFARTVGWTSGADGLRTLGWEEKRPRVLCLGSDNTTPVLQANENAWWGVMAAEAAKSGRPVAVGAIGTASQPTSVALRWLRHFAATTKPEVVVLSFGPGEVLYRPAGYRADPAALQQPVAFLPGGLKGAVFKSSALARHWRLSRQGAKMREQQAQFLQENALRDRFNEECAAWRDAPMLPEMPWIDDPADEIAATLREFAALAKEFGFRPVVLWEPWPHRAGMSAEETRRFRRLVKVQVDGRVVDAKVDPAFVDNRMKAYRNRAAAVCDGLGLTLVDATPAGKAGESHFDDTLLTDAGARAVGLLVAPAILRTGEN